MSDRPSEWSYSQYGLFRRLLGVYLLAHFVTLMPYGAELFSSRGMLADGSLSPLLGIVPSLLVLDDSPWVVQLLIAVGVLASLLIVIGRWDRLSALLAWYALACLFGRNPLIANPGLPVAGWLLLLHAALPKPRSAGWPSGRPGLAELAAWTLPRPFLIAAWTVLALSYSYSGYTKLMSPSWVAGDAIAAVLDNPLARDHALRGFLQAWPDWALKGLTWGILYVELLFAPLALLKRFRVWLWGGMLCVQLGFLTLLNFADLTAPMLLIHLLTVEQRWLSLFEKRVPATVYYDGNCALCHGLVRFALVEDRRKRLKFAPLQSDTAIGYLGDVRYRRRLDTIVVRSAEGATYEKSAAAVEVLYRLGGWWALLASVLALVPAAVRDAGYDFVGSRRLRFGRTGSLCPVVPPALATRFLASDGGAAVDRDGAS